ncbi:MAG: PBP1A family penicillin-binding protein [Candidatus Cloacimonetes bacterium]|nr:PBP1A family penicillin-binding protein [Candidatus Cloacimonadota bacterium]
MFKKILKICVLLVFFIVAPIVAILGGGLLSFLQNIWMELPQFAHESMTPALRTKITDRNNKELRSVRIQTARHALVGIDEIPPHVRNAFIAIEDTRFYSHIGIDFKRIVGALIVDIKKGRLAHGASTITQQLVRNIYLSHEKTFTRKISEIILSLKMEYEFTKPEILEMYLNTVFFGGSNYGIESASKDYFGKSASDLSILEAASLAAVLKAPNAYSPKYKPKKNRGRRKLVLKKMAEHGYISKKVYKDLVDKELVTVAKKNVKTVEKSEAPYFVDEVLKRAKSIFDRKTWKKGGLVIQTTLDLDLQNIASEVFSNAKILVDNPITDEKRIDGSLVVRDNVTGEILALVGGRDYASSKYNRAVQSKRQAGSSFKPFVYATAFEQGINSNIIINDEPISYKVSESEKNWTPENYGGKYHGPSLLRTALEHSYNIVAIKLLDMVKPSNLIETVNLMGIQSHMAPVLSLALGVKEVSSVEISSAYSVFANEGIYTAPNFIKTVKDRLDNEVYRHHLDQVETISASSAYKTLNMLESVVQRGSGRRAKVKGIELAGKTGTSQDYIDTWFVALTPVVSIAVHFGYNDRQSLGKKASSSIVAAPVVGALIKRLKAELPQYVQGSFKDLKPKSLVSQKICRKSGLLALDSCPLKVEELFDKKQTVIGSCPIHGSMIESFLVD